MDSDEGYNYEFDEDEECSEEDSGAEEEEDEDDDEPDDDNLDLGEVELVEPGLGVGGERDGLLCGETGGGGGSALPPGPRARRPRGRLEAESRNYVPTSCQQSWQFKKSPENCEKNT